MVVATLPVWPCRYLLAHGQRAGHVEGSMLDQARNQNEGQPMTSDILIHLWLGFLVAMFCVVLYAISRLQRRHRKAMGLSR